mmetsp:Transcript_1660/g.2909  ORF Transcript_1660/g.2909 Transcript_1660/m.2909 type:complete len:271 (-) Transcript_1660:898-1710(-)
MGKKRKSSAKSSGESAAIDKSASSHTAVNKSRFETFPLHLLPDKSDSKSSANFKLQELFPGRVWAVPSFFTPKECQSWIDFCESTAGFEYTAHPASKYIAHRECFRMQQSDARELSARIYRRLQGHILKRLQQETVDLFPPDRKIPLGCNPNLRVYKYEKGHSFGKHVDGSTAIGEEGGDLLAGGSTEMTMLIYLSDCQGGATRFHSSSISRASRTNGKPKKSSSFAFEPKIGALLLHVHGEHCLEHEADPVLGGQKYVLRTDLVFGNSY